MKGGVNAQIFLVHSRRACMIALSGAAWAVAMPKGLNNKIRTAFRRAYGFKAREYRGTMIYLIAGRLNLPTQNLREAILLALILMRTR
jgi:hypothetical protein